MAIKPSKAQRRTPRSKRAGGQIMAYNIYNYPGPLLGSIETREGKQILKRSKGGSQQNLLGKVKLVDGRLVVTGPQADELKKILHDLRSYARVKDDRALFEVIPDYFRGALLANPIDDAHDDADAPLRFGLLKVTDDLSTEDFERFIRKLTE